MVDPVEEYQTAIADIEEAHKIALRAFVKYFVTNWKATKEEWVKAFDVPAPTDEWFLGFGAGVDSAEGCLEHFFGDYHP